MNLGAAGENGDLFFFTEAGPGDRIDFGFTPADLPTQIPMSMVLAALRDGLAYVLLHSQAFPDGEVRGQIRPATP